MDAKPSPASFQPKDNPAFILHGKLSTSYETVRGAATLIGGGSLMPDASSLYQM